MKERMLTGGESVATRCNVKNSTYLEPIRAYPTAAGGLPSFLVDSVAYEVLLSSTGTLPRIFQTTLVIFYHNLKQYSHNLSHYLNSNSSLKPRPWYFTKT
jgi:hypothetical protein